jgi:transcription elongation factor GreA
VLEKIKIELQERISVTRPKIVTAISEARAHGDLKENAEYHAAKEEQGHNERRIQEIETTIATANIVDVSKIKNDNKVIFGSTIILLDMETNEKKNTKLLAKMRQMQKKVCYIYKSPIALELVSKHTGDFVSVKTPAGEKIMRLLKLNIFNLSIKYHVNLI